ncbi:MAG: hypothetical protein R2852_06870 [Bacteroidia bacterium]
MKNLLLYVLIFFSLGCMSEPEKIESRGQNILEYIFVNRSRHYLDTLSRTLIKTKYSDSIYRLSYNKIRNGDTSEEYFEFPISNSKLTTSKLQNNSRNKISLLGEKVIHYDKLDYKVYKYLYDDENSFDEVMLYFFIPEFGMVISKAAWWGAYDKLVDNGKPDEKDDLFFITEMIAFDYEFFHKY